MFPTLLVLCLLCQFTYGKMENDAKMKSFSHSIKAGRCSAGQELTVFEHTTGPGVITEQWYTGAGCFDEKTILKYYIDGDAVPTIEANLFMMHGIGFYDKKLPAWGTKWIGHTATNGGLYNTYRIPFQKSIRVTFTPQVSEYYWYIVRGVENYPVVIGDLKLPPNAKLVLHKIEDKIYPPLAYVPLLMTDKPGIVFSASLRGESKNFRYLEGCFGTIIEYAHNKTDMNLLSSGTEDFFLSAYYFNKGIFHTDDSGLTYFKAPGTMSAYKFFHQDPVIMRGKFYLMWRASEVSHSCWVRSTDEQSDKGNNDHLGPISKKMNFAEEPDYIYFDEKSEIPYEPVKITSYVWTYQW